MRPVVASLVACLVVCVAAARAQGDAPIGRFDHDKTRFPLTGRHQMVACESCHPQKDEGAARVWTGAPLDCHGCHGDRRNHKGALGTQCQACHDPSGWKSISHPAAKHQFALVGRHQLDCVACHRGGAELVPAAGGCADCHRQPHGGTDAACTTCHNLERWTTVAFQHANDPGQLGGKHKSATCLGCHPGFHFAGTTFQCQGCHARNQPHEDHGACTGCHNALSWTALSLTHDAAAPKSRFRVDAAFDHVAHGRVVIARGGKATCASCHAAFVDPLRPSGRPAMTTCEGCHDGTRAFAALGTRCAACHHAPAGTPPAPAAAIVPKPFRHDAHQHTLKVDDCTTCHDLGTTARETHAGREHQPCARCHAAEFRTAGAPICLACHLSNEPFAPNPLRPTVRPPSDLRLQSMPHAPHLEAGLACAGCHADQAARPAAAGGGMSHALCGRCHTPTSKTASRLPLERCSGCHVRASAPWPAEHDRQWSTRARFRHDERHLAATCDSCHRPNGGATLTPPTMQGCASCHDGQRAFKVTGFGCARCHGPSGPPGPNLQENHASERS